VCVCVCVIHPFEQLAKTLQVPPHFLRTAHLRSCKWLQVCVKHTHLHSSIHTLILSHTYTHTHIHTRTCTYTHTYTHTHTHMHMHIHTHIHTHTHTHILTQVRLSNDDRAALSTIRALLDVMMPAGGAGVCTFMRVYVCGSVCVCVPRGGVL